MANKSQILLIVLVFVAVFNPGISQAKGGTEQDQIILLNDSAVALEDSNPDLSKSLTKFADEKEKEWEDSNANKNEPVTPVTAKDIPLLQERIRILKEAALAIGPTYPLITKGLDQMVKDMDKIVGPLAWASPKESDIDRHEVIKKYLDEFCFYQEPSLIYQAIKDVLLRIPYKDFLNVTDRQRPVLFTEFYDSGTARFASSSEFIVTKDDPPCCKEGFTIIKLGMSLGLAKTPGPIEGVVAHEIAHRVLDTIRKGNVNCDAERAANALIIKWGFKKEFKEASRLFGQKKGDPAGCQEVPHKINLQ